MSFYINDFRNHLQNLSDKVDQPYNEPASRQTTSGSIEEAYSAMKQPKGYQRPAPSQLNEQGMGGGFGGGVRPTKGSRLSTQSNPQGGTPGGPPPMPPGDGGWQGDYFLNQVIEYYGQSVPPAPYWLDFDGDGVIGVNDLLHVIEHNGGTAS